MANHNLNIDRLLKYKQFILSEELDLKGNKIQLAML